MGRHNSPRKGGGFFPLILAVVIVIVLVGTITALAS